MHDSLLKLRHRVRQIATPGKITWDESFRPPWAVHGHGRFTAGSRTYWIGDCSMTAWKRTDSIDIGAYCCIASGARIIAGGNHDVNALSTYPFSMIDRWRDWDAEQQAPQHVVVGNDVWVGTRAMILGNVTVGDGAVIGAGSVVVDDVEPYTIVVGSPARLLRHRFTAEEVALLQRLRWWDWPEAMVLAAEPVLRSGDVLGLEAFASSNGLPGDANEAGAVIAPASRELTRVEV